ncbi:hypothetical protein FSB78_00595 [Sphingomonas ginsenosidivorax]|uniref:HTH luxR-type domain-containing protein n=1 Tax=Sphingomonas ginsenosidivorax TaxID=862135 RepID=A0A5C6UC76_9SPHN|nr:hypothetical protein FSB78_00595 [Sphingomonas ginsenosidivorax]
MMHILVGLPHVSRDPEAIRRFARDCEPFWDGLSGAGAVRQVVMPPASTALSPAAAARHDLPPGRSRYARGLAVSCDAESGQLEGIVFRDPMDVPIADATAAAFRAALPLIVSLIFAEAANDRSAGRLSMMRSVLDRMAMPTFLVDERMTPLLTNASAGHLLRRRSIFLRPGDGTIATRYSRETRNLRDAVIETITEKVDMRAVRINDDDANLMLAVVVPARFHDGAAERNVAMIVVHELGAISAPPCVLAALGLLPSEQRFLDSFLRSNSLAETAERINLSQETARTYLKRVRAKLGVHRQIDLARLVLGLVPPLFPATETVAAE